ncbi:MAG TPA: branched-chain amino acid ABC transporter permease [Thermodesulfobacteriota bacterium]|nr:branched-chain amino acid ABC transporter permease [Thermodesulfobacteriota bacterium]
MGRLKGNTFLLFIILLAVVVSVVQNAFVLHILIMIFTAAALGLAWNVIGGYGGQLSFGHAAFYGIGAYTSTLLFTKFGVTPWVGMFAGGFLAVVASLILGIPCFRLRGTYFTLATIAFAEVLRILAVYFKDLTGGSIGIVLQFKGGFWNFMFRNREPYAFIALGFMALAYYVSLWLEKSRLGYYLTALKENEDGARAVGINTFQSKLIGLMISAFMTAVIGSFFAQYLTFIEPESEFSLGLSIAISLPVMIGGIGTAIGPVIGSFIITPLQELLRVYISGEYQGLQNIIYGIILVIVVICTPQGLHKWITEGFRGRKKTAESRQDG